MISVLSLRLPLSGNKIIFFIVVCVLVSTSLPSCALFEPASGQQSPNGTVTTTPIPSRTDGTKPEREELDPIQGRRVYDPQTGTYVYIEAPPTEKMDTVRWADQPESLYPPITADGSNVPVSTSTPPPTRPTVVGTTDNNSQLLSVYNVSVMLPFLADRFDTLTRRIPDNSLWALHFYSGLRMGFDEAAGRGAKLNVSVFDTEGSTSTVTQLMSNEAAVRGANLIVGPYRREGVSEVAEAIKRTGQVLVSPYSAATGISDNNPEYVQVNPSLETHLEAMVRHALDTYRPNDVVVVARNDPQERARVQVIQDAYRKLTYGRTGVRPIRELIVTGNSFNFSSYLSGERVAFIVPIWGDPAFVNDFMRQLSRARGSYNQVFVYGMPQWEGYEGLDRDLLARLNVHITSSIYIDNLDPGVRAFRRRFVERFGHMPRDEAFVGYDTGRYFGRVMSKYGTKFQYQLERESERLLHTEFRFERVVRPVATVGKENNPIDRWENKFLNVLRFQDGAYAPVR